MKKPSPREEMTSYDHMAKLPISWFPIWCFSLHDGRSVVFSKFHCMPFPLFTPMAVPLAQASWKFHVHSVEGEKKLQSQKSLFLALEFHKPISWNKAQDLDQCVSYKSNSCPGLDKDYLGWEMRSSKNRCRELRHFCLLERGPVTCCSLAECLVWKIPWLQLEGWRTNRWVHRGSAFPVPWAFMAGKQKQRYTHRPRTAFLLLITKPMEWSSPHKRGGQDTKVGEPEEIWGCDGMQQWPTG